VGLDCERPRTIQEKLATGLHRGQKRSGNLLVNTGKADREKLFRFIANSWESIVVAGILLTVSTVELNAVFQGGAQGQDFY
jgi:hypothetical protein